MTNLECVYSIAMICDFIHVLSKNISSMETRDFKIKLSKHFFLLFAVYQKLKSNQNKVLGTLAQQTHSPVRYFDAARLICKVTCSCVNINQMIFLRFASSWMLKRCVEWDKNPVFNHLKEMERKYSELDGHEIKHHRCTIQPKLLTWAFLKIFRHFYRYSNVMYGFWCLDQCAWNPSER